MKIWWTILLFLICTSCLYLGNPQKQVNKINAERFLDLDIIWDLELLSKPPGYLWIDSTSNVKSLTYESVPYKEKPTRVFAYYSNPDLLMGRETNHTFPGIVLIHGGGGRAYKAWVEKWAADGYAAIAMDLGGADGSGKPVSMPGPGQSHEFKFSAIEKGNLKDVWTYHAASSVILAHSLLLGMPEVNPEKTCVTGISWGGYLTCMVAGLDDRFKAAVPVYGCGFYNESDVFKEPLSELGPFYEEQWMKYFDPSVYLPYAKASLFFINGNKDKFYNIVPYSKTYNLPQKTNKNICIKPDMKHSHTYGWQPIEIRYFFDSILKDGVPLPKLGKVEPVDSIISARYSSFVGLRSAMLYYSSDTLLENKDRKWYVEEAQIDPVNKVIKSNAQCIDFNYAFFYVTDIREVSVSSPIFIK